jgi:FkbM family methyltransferase
VLAVEPAPSLVTQLRFNVQSNGFQNIDIAPVAIGDETGTATLHVVSGQQGRSSLYEVSGSDLQLTVPVEPLLSVLVRHGIARVDAIKIDIEGSGDRALLPFFATAAREM